jgi:transposase
LLEELGHEVEVANPRKVRLIYGNDRKSDRFDAEALGRLLRVDRKLLSPIQHRGLDAQRDLALIRTRAALVRSRTLLINHVRGTVKSSGYRLRACSSESFSKLTWEGIPVELRISLEGALATIEELTKRIREAERRIEERARKAYPETEWLRTVPGVGALTALAFVTTLEDPQRFKRSRQVGAYVGLAQGRQQSAGRDPQRKITKAGDPYLRQLLVGSAQYLLGPFGPDTALKRWGLQLAARGGKNAKKRAVVAVARKLSVLLHRLWTSGTSYEPFPGRCECQTAEVSMVVSLS